MAPQEKKPPGANPAAGGSELLSTLRFDRVDPLFANLLAGDDEPVILCERAAGAQHSPGGVLLPPHFIHDFLQGGASLALEHRDHQAGLAALPRGSRFFRYRRGGRFFARVAPFFAGPSPARRRAFVAQRAYRLRVPWPGELRLRAGWFRWLDPRKEKLLRDALQPELANDHSGRKIHAKKGGGNRCPF